MLVPVLVLALAVAVTPHPTPPPTPAPKLPPLYVVLRMDDVQVDAYTDIQTSFIQWALTRKVKLNLGIITNRWPQGCHDDPGLGSADGACADPVASALRNALRNGTLRMADASAPHPLLEVFNHGFDHEKWPEPCTHGDYAGKPYAYDPAWMAADLASSTRAMARAFPGALASTFVPPENIANEAVVAALPDHGLRVISSQGTIRKDCDDGQCANATGQCTAASEYCTQCPDGTSCYNYLYSPCQGVDGSGTWTETDPSWYVRVAAENFYCVPADDIYFTNTTGGGFQPVDKAMFPAPSPDVPVLSIPTGCANHDFSSPETGITVADAIGSPGEVGCLGGDNQVCTIRGSAVTNAKRSNGLHWTVMMMHPQTIFPKRQSYVQWLDLLRGEVQKMPEYSEVHFVHFSDLTSFCVGDSIQLDRTHCEAWVGLFDSTGASNGAQGASWNVCKDPKYRIDPCSCSKVVTCNTNRTRIVGLKLGENALAGALPPLLAEMDGLRLLDLRGNQLNGTLPDLKVFGKGNNCTLFDFPRKNNFACPLPLNAVAYCKKQKPNATKGELVSVTASDCVHTQSPTPAPTPSTQVPTPAPPQVPTPAPPPAPGSAAGLGGSTIAGIAVGGLALIGLLNKQRERMRRASGGNEYDSKRRVARVTAPLLDPPLAAYVPAFEPAALAHRDQAYGAPAPPGKPPSMSSLGGPGDDEMEPTSFAQRPQKMMSTSNVGKYQIGQNVFDMGAEKHCGVVSKVQPAPGEAPGRGSITISVYKTRLLETSCLAKYSIGQHIHNMGANRDLCGFVAAREAKTPQGERGPGTLTIFLDA